MRTNNWLMLALTNLLIVLISVLQFIPGPHNSFVIGLSIFAQTPGFLGLVLVPIAIVWILFEIKKSRNKNVTYWKPSYIMAISATVIAVVISLLISLVVLSIFSVTAGIAGIALIGLGLIHSIKGIKKIKSNPSPVFYAVPLYLLTIPLVSLASRMFLEEPVSAYGRNFAIHQGGELISAIEDYKNKEGDYPETLQDLKKGFLHEIPSPGVMGIKNFRYNKTNDDYYLSFSQWVELGIVEEVVLYDKNPEEIARQQYNYHLDQHRVRGAFAGFDTRHDHWRYYYCD